MQDRIQDLRRGHEFWRPSPAAAPSGLRIAQMITVNVSSFGDYMLCRTWDGTTEGATMIAVARPFLLRKSVFDGFIIDDYSYAYASVSQRTKTRQSDRKAETQVIVPGYVNSDLSDIRHIIYAATGIAGGTKVLETGNELDPTKPVAWLDLNVDGRAWAKKA